MLSSKYWIANCIILTLLALGSFTPTLAFAAPLANTGNDWQHMNGNSYSQTFSAQTQINKDNVNDLEVKWVVPISGRASAPAAVQAAIPSEGIQAPTVIAKGKAYSITNFLKTTAVDMKTGRVAWEHQYTVDIAKEKERLPINPSSGLHIHGFRYWEKGNAILIGGIVCDFYAINADTGKENFRITDLCLNVPGSIYKQAPNALIGSSNTAEIATWDKGNQFIVGQYGSLQGDFSSFRNWIGGLDMDTKQVVWRVFLQPPQDKPSKDWALENCDIGYIVTTPCQTVAQYDRSLLEYDWQAVPGQPPHKLNGVSATWGQPVIDDETDTMYIATGNQSPYSNLTSRPGPNLYGSTLVAFDLPKGKMKWWVSEYPHDPYDMDCGFYSPMLIEVPGLGTTGKALVKACKDGILNYIDAATGKPLRRYDPITSLYGEKFRANIIYDPAPVVDKANLPTYQHVTGNWEGFREMLTLPWAGAGKMEMTDVGRNCAKCDRNNVLLPLGHSGMVGESSTDGAGTVYSFAYLTPEYMKTWDLELAGSQGKASWMITKTGASENGTFYAQDALTGKVKWTWGPFPGIDRRMSGTQRPVTGGMVIISYDGNLAFLDKDTGKQLYKLNLGSPIPTGPSVGKDSAGNSMIVVAVNAGARPSTSSPGGALVGIGLRASSQAKTTTMTTTQTSTTVSTSVLTTTSATTATTTVVSTQPAQTQTTTVVSSITETSGLPSEVTYAAVGVAVIAIAAAAVLVMRKK